MCIHLHFQRIWAALYCHRHRTQKQALWLYCGWSWLSRLRSSSPTIRKPESFCFVGGGRRRSPKLWNRAFSAAYHEPVAIRGNPLWQHEFELHASTVYANTHEGWLGLHKRTAVTFTASRAYTRFGTVRIDSSRSFPQIVRWTSEQRKTKNKNACSRACVWHTLSLHLTAFRIQVVVSWAARLPLIGAWCVAPS